MSPEQKIKHLILLKHEQWVERELPPITADNIDEVYEEIDGDDYALQDARYEMRESGQETGLPARHHSRHYESDEVAVKYIDGTWVGFTYWYGGGKYGEPEAIDWMDDAYDVVATQETRIVNVFSLAKEAA